MENWSYCIGAGTASGAPNTDLDGNSRIQPQGSNPDMGVYENPFATPQYHPRLLNVPTSYTTIQSALDSANATDTVLVQSGTYIENIIWPIVMAYNFSVLGIPVIRLLMVVVQVVSVSYTHLRAHET